MKFGKLVDIRAVDFRLPPMAENNERMKAYSSHSGPDLYVGCTGWSMKEWVGTVYPQGSKPKDFLREYCRQFNTIELNTTHYRIPDLETVGRWKSESPSDFRFCPKIPQLISHSRDLGLGSEALTQFTGVLEALGSRLGPCFLQLPPYFGTDRMPLLQRFFEKWPREFPLSVEMRHESWFQSQTVKEQWLNQLAEAGIIALMTDVAGRRDVLHMGLSSNKTLIRFVGNDLHPTDFQRVDAWLSRLDQMKEQGVSEIYFFTHEPDNLQAPQMADYLVQQALEKYSFRTRGPKLLDPGAGRQISLFD